MDIQRPILYNPTNNEVEISVHILVSENIYRILHPAPPETPSRPRQSGCTKPPQQHDGPSMNFNPRSPLPPSSQASFLPKEAERRTCLGALVLTSPPGATGPIECSMGRHLSLNKSLSAPAPLEGSGEKFPWSGREEGRRRKRAARKPDAPTHPPSALLRLNEALLLLAHRFHLGVGRVTRAAAELHGRPSARASLDEEEAGC